LALVYHKDVAGRIHGERVGEVQNRLSGGAAVAAESRVASSRNGDNLSIRCDLSDAVVGRVGEENRAVSALDHARTLGASDAGAEASEGCGLSVSVRKGELETVARREHDSWIGRLFYGPKTDK